MANKKIIVSTATIFDCPLVVDMQIENHKTYLSEEERKNGYVTLLTTNHYLQKIKHSHRILIARHIEGSHTGHHAGYLIAVNYTEAQEHPFLRKFSDFLRNRFNVIEFVIIAQIGVERKFVGTRSGIGTSLYHYFFERIIPPSHYRNVITEVAKDNDASLQFHLKMGFTARETYTDDFGNEMILLIKKVNQDKPTEEHV